MRTPLSHRYSELGAFVTLPAIFRENSIGLDVKTKRALEKALRTVIFEALGSLLN